MGCDLIEKPKAPVDHHMEKAKNMEGTLVTVDVLIGKIETDLSRPEPGFNVYL